MNGFCQILQCIPLLFSFKVVNRRGRQFLFCDSLPHAREDYAWLPSQHISAVDLNGYLTSIFSGVHFRTKAVKIFVMSQCRYY